MSNFEIGTDKTQVLEMFPQNLQKDILDIRIINRRHNIPKLSQAIAYIDFTTYEIMKIAQGILNNKHFKGRQLRAAESDPPKKAARASDLSSKPEDSMFEIKGKVFLFINNLPFDTEQSKVMKSLGLQKGEFRSKGGFGFLEIEDTRENWVVLNKLKDWRADKRGNKVNDRQLNPDTVKKIFWCGGRACSLEVEKGRGCWKMPSEFPKSQTQVLSKVDAEDLAAESDTVIKKLKPSNVPPANESPSLGKPVSNEKIPELVQESIQQPEQTPIEEEQSA